MLATDEDRTTYLDLYATGAEAERAHAPSAAVVPHRVEELQDLVRAANRGSDEILRWLAEHGARLDIADKVGRTAVDWAHGVFLATHPSVDRPQTVALIESLLDPPPENREGGYLAVGSSAGRGSYIGHFCTSVHDWRRDGEAIMQGLTEQFAAAGFGESPGSKGFGALFDDPDGIEIQFLPAPDTLVTAANPSTLVPWHQGMVTPHGLQNVLLRLRNLERALAWYGILCGSHQFTPDRRMA